MTGKIIPNKGFTLIETLVAVMILASSIAGPLSIASRSLNNSLVAKDQVGAFFLVQDAIEYVRYVRDSNTLKSGDWITSSGASPAGVDLSPCNTAVNAQGCYFDTTSRSYTDLNGNNPSIPVSCGAACPAMYYDSSTALYTYSNTSTTKSPYTRQVTLTSISSTEYQVSVTVSWKDVGGTTRRVSAAENIFKWQ